VTGTLPTPKLSGGPIVGPQYERVTEKFFIFSKKSNFLWGLFLK